MISGNQNDRFLEHHRILSELKDFLNDLLFNETLSESASTKSITLIDRLELILKTPELPPRSSTISPPTLSKPDSLKNDDDKTCASQEFLEQQRELSRQGTIWRGDVVRSKFPYQSHAVNNIPLANNDTPLAQNDTNATDKVNFRREDSAIYEKIDIIPKQLNVPPQFKKSSNSLLRTSNPPPVPERKGRSSATDKPALPTSPIQLSDGSFATDVVLVHDLQNPLYSGLLRNVRSNTKQWCVIKRQILYLFNDLNEPADFMADLHKYEVFNDPEQALMFRVGRIGEPSIILAAVDEEQYELWHHAFQRAKILVDSEDGRYDGAVKLSDYVSIRGSNDQYEDNVEMSDNDSEYVKPDLMLQKLDLSAAIESYESMNSTAIKHFPPQDDYELMENAPTLPIKRRFTMVDNHTDYSSMPLPPTPDVSPPKLPTRTITASRYSDDYSESDVSISASSNSDNDIRKEMESYPINTWPRKGFKGKQEKEVEFFHDITAVFVGILYQRRMLAIWQKRLCKVKNQCLLCYRSFDSTEPCLNIHLPGYQLDRAEETWKNYSFKMFKEDADVIYFAAESRAGLIKWLSVLAKEINKEKFEPVNKISVYERQIVDGVVPNSSGTSNESLPIPKIHKQLSVKSYSDPCSDFDADNESIGSEESIDSLDGVGWRTKLLKGNKRKLKRKSQSFEDPDALLQGYLYRKLPNHWALRWCVVKNQRFLSYKRSPTDPPDVAVLLMYASLNLFPDSEMNKSGRNVFQLRYEGEQKISLSAKNKDDYLEWINCLKMFVASDSEEAFPYINVPPLSSSLPDSNSLLSHGDVLDKRAFVKPTVNDGFYRSRVNTLPLPPRIPTLLRHLPSDVPPRSKTEIKDSIHYGILTELQFFHQSYRHIEHLVVITKEKWLKFYTDISSTLPTAVFHAQNVKVVEENGCDSIILRLHIESENKELILKASCSKEREEWKAAFDRVHYEQIGDIQKPETKLQMSIRKRAKTIEKKNKNEPVLLSHSKTLPHLGKMKKRARDEKAKLQFNEGDMQYDDGRPKTASSEKNIKSATIGHASLTGKGSSHSKGNSFPRRQSAEMFSQKKGFSSLIRSFTVDTLTRKSKNKSYVLPKDEDVSLKETHRGVIKYVVAENDLQERFCRISGKIFYCFLTESDRKPLFKVPLKDCVIEEFDNYRFQITAMESGSEYLFALQSESELETWLSALCGDDKIHSALMNVPISSVTQTSPTNLSMSPRSSPPFPPAIQLVAEPPYVPDKIESNRLSIMSVGSSMATSCSTLSESDSCLKSLNEPVRLRGVMFEWSERHQRSSKRHVLLKDTVMELYNDENDNQPVTILQLSDITLLNSADNRIYLKSDEGASYAFLVETDGKTWKKELKKMQKKSTNKKPRGNTTNATRKLGSVKRDSMFLVEEDLKAIEQHVDDNDPSNIISGVLVERFADSRRKPKERFCWIRMGIFYVAKHTTPSKALKTIDLSSVVIIDESDPDNSVFTFKLEYTIKRKLHNAIFDTNNQTLADKWMVAVSMGILFHRLSGCHVHEPYIDKETPIVKDFEFYHFTETDNVSSAAEVERSNQLGADIKLEKGREDGEDGDILPIFESLSAEPQTPENSTVDVITNENGSPEKLPDIDVSVDASNISKRPVTVQLSLLKDEDDQVFRKISREEDDASNEFLDNIPEKENAEETFRNIKGILRQQESIRRAILKRQSTKLAKVPPKLKPKPRKNPFRHMPSSIKFKQSPEALAMGELHEYLEQLEGERVDLVRRMRSANSVVEKAKDQTHTLAVTGREVAMIELRTATEDLKTLQQRLQVLDKETKNVNSSINRKVSSSFGAKKEYLKSESALWFDSPSKHNPPRTLQSAKEFNSEPILNETIRSLAQSPSADRGSIII